MVRSFAGVICIAVVLVAGRVAAIDTNHKLNLQDTSIFGFLTDNSICDMTVLVHYQLPCKINAEILSEFVAARLCDNHHF